MADTADFLSSISTQAALGVKFHHGGCVLSSTVREMLYFVGLGLGDAKDITVKGLEIVKKADYVFLEAYTSILCVGKEVLVST